jgi:hypothetical protein
MAGKALGKRPDYAKDPLVDKLLSMVMALAGEVSVLRERVDTIERLAGDRGVLSAADIEAYQPDADALAERDGWRSDFLNRLLWIVRAELESEAAGESASGYEELVREIAGGAGPSAEG